jgi:hypothetical protein
MIGTPDPRPFHRGRRGGRGLDEPRLVAGLGPDLGRRVQPFQLRITVIPVAGKELWRLDPHHVLLTDELLRDSVEYRGRITPVLQAPLTEELDRAELRRRYRAAVALPPAAPAHRRSHARPAARTDALLRVAAIVRAATCSLSPRGTSIRRTASCRRG